MDESHIGQPRPVDDESIPDDWRDDGVVYVVRRSESSESESGEIKQETEKSRLELQKDVGYGKFSVSLKLENISLTRSKNFSVFFLHILKELETLHVKMSS